MSNDDNIIPFPISNKIEFNPPKEGVAKIIELYTEVTEDDTYVFVQFVTDEIDAYSIAQSLLMDYSEVIAKLSVIPVEKHKGGDEVDNHEKFLSLLSQVDFISRVLNEEQESQSNELLGKLAESLEEAGGILEKILQEMK